MPTPPATPTPTPKPRYRFTREQKIKSKLLITTLYKTGKKRAHHPLVCHTLRRDDNRPARLAISIGRPCGNSPERNTIKRKLREAYRLMQHELPPGVDFLLVVRPHKILPMQAYQDKLRQLVGGL